MGRRINLAEGLYHTAGSVPWVSRGMSITQKDIKILRRMSSTSSRSVVFISISLMIIFFLILAAINFRLCQRFALADGLTVSEVFSQWLEGISPSELYSGKLLLAIQRLQAALTQIAVAIIFGLVLWAQQSSALRNARILKFIEENEQQKASTKL